MIQEAHIGLGIFGKEGRQAVLTSDYAFARFKYLQRALLLHGHYYYMRLSTLVLYFFYKARAFLLPLCSPLFIHFPTPSSRMYIYLYEHLLLPFQNIAFIAPAFYFMFFCAFTGTVCLFTSTLSVHLYAHLLRRVR